MPVDREYIISERFIHDGLVKQCAGLVPELYKLWKKKRSIAPSLLLWPVRAVPSVEGSMVDGLIVMDLSPYPPNEQPILGAVNHVNAYAFALIEQRAEDVQILLESPHGTHVWRLPIVKSGDTTILGNVKESKDTATLHILWSTKRGSS